MYEEEYLVHHGILGQHWGIRRYQNPDGTLTEAGKARYGTVENLQKVKDAKAAAEVRKIQSKADSKVRKQEIKDTRKQAKAEDKDRNARLKDAKAAEKIAEKEARIARAKRKKATQMSDAELNEAINRLRQEKAYNELAFPKRENNNQNLNNAKKEGKAFASRFAKEVVGNAVITVGSAAAKDWLQKQVDDKWGVELGRKGKPLDKYEQAKKDADYARNILNQAKDLYSYSSGNYKKNNNGGNGMSKSDMQDIVEEALKRRGL